MTWSVEDGFLMIGQRPTVRVNTTWREHAECRSGYVDLFFPAGDTGVLLNDIRAAKAVCERCQVQDDCVQFALETNQQDGIWGGTTEPERRRVRRAWLADLRRQARASG
jgi:WhiB family redox-sensing transcriptional regulator